MSPPSMGVASKVTSRSGFDLDVIPCSLRVPNDARGCLLRYRASDVVLQRPKPMMKKLGAQSRLKRRRLPSAGGGTHRGP